MGAYFPLWTNFYWLLVDVGGVDISGHEWTLVEIIGCQWIIVIIMIHFPEGLPPPPNPWACVSAQHRFRADAS